MSFFYTKTFWVGLVLILVFFLLGIFIGKIGTKTSVTPVNKPAEQTLSPNIFTSQSAVIKGVIIQINQGNATVENNLKLKATFPLAQSIFITKFDSKGKASASSSLNDIELNKNATINLEFVKSTNLYNIVAVTYIPPLPGQKTVK